MTPEELKKTYSTLSTSELLEIVDNKFGYTELAVSIALAELATRQVSEEEIRNYKEQQVAKSETFINRNIVDDLTLLQKNLFYFIWIPLINFAFKQNFHDDGYILKLRQANYYSLVGFALFILAGLASAFFGFSDLTFLAIWILGFLPAYALDETFNRRAQIRRLQRLYGNPEAEEESGTEDEEFRGNQH